MRMRTLLTTVVVGTLVAGTLGATAQASTAPSPDRAGTMVTWGNAANASANAAMAVPGDLTAPVAAMATTSRSTAAVTVDGELRVWGLASAAEVTEAPADVNDAVAVALSLNAGLVLHRDGSVTGWGTPALAEVPVDLRAKAIAIGFGGSGYAVTTTGTLRTWGTPAFGDPPGGLTDLVDVAAGQLHAAALRADGSIEIWRYEAEDPGEDAVYAMLTDVPDFGSRKVTQLDVNNGATGVVLDDGSIEIWGMTTPANPPNLESVDVVNLDLGDSNAGAVADDGTVRTWGTNTFINTHPGSLDGEPAASIVLGSQHSAVIVTTFRELSKPAISGTPQVGKTLTAAPGTLSLAPDAPATGQWYAGATAITGKTGTTLALDESLVGKTISYRSTATRDGQTVVSSSDATAPVAAAPKASATVSGKAKVSGKTKKFAKKVKLTVTVSTPTGVSPAGTVTIALKGKTKKTVTAPVNAQGVATKTIKKVKRGKYTAALTYSGNAAVNAATGKAKFRA